MAVLEQSPHGPGPSIDQIRALGGPRAALEARAGLFADAAESQAAGHLEDWDREGIKAIPYTDALYPGRLVETAAAPAILFVRGALTEDDTRGISIIGTRQPSGQGLETANQIAQAVVADGRTVISGLALGIDTAAHAGALGVGGRSIAVLGNGLQHVYPSANTNLQERLDGLVSQFLPGQEPNRKTFPERNAVMSGLSAATVIVEAGEFSGARIQARHALAQGRRLFLIAPLLDQQWALALASQAGASVIHTAAQLIAGINQWTD